MTDPAIKEEDKFQPADNHLLGKKNQDNSHLHEPEIISDFGSAFSLLSVIQHDRMKEKGFYDSFFRTREILSGIAEKAFIQLKWYEGNNIATESSTDNLRTNYEQAQSDLLQFTTNFLLKQKCLFHEEISESASALREGDKADDKLPEFSGDAVECADAIIRILDYAGFRGLDVGSALLHKMKHNLSRPKMHGKNA